MNEQEILRQAEEDRKRFESENEATKQEWLALAEINSALKWKADKFPPPLVVFHLRKFAAQVARDTEAKYGASPEEVKALAYAAKSVVCLHKDCDTESESQLIRNLNRTLAPWGVK